MFGVAKWLSQYLMREYEPPEHFLCDFDKIVYELRPGDVILVEGHSLVSRVIQQVTLSPWSHSCIYIGRIHQIEDKVARRLVESHPGINPDDRLIIEGYMGEGIVFRTIESYEKFHLRICRPRGLSRQDSQNVIAAAISQVGFKYDTWQIFDLARFLLPWSFLPKSWRSSLFTYKPGVQTKTVCSTMIATSFQSVHFPILPLIKYDKNGNVGLYQRNPKLFTPRDFDYSPYFDIIKYPYIEHSDPALYRYLPWEKRSDRGQEYLTETRKEIYLDESKPGIRKCQNSHYAQQSNDDFINISDQNTGSKPKDEPNSDNST